MAEAMSYFPNGKKARDGVFEHPVFVLSLA